MHRRGNDPMHSLLCIGFFVGKNISCYNKREPTERILIKMDYNNVNISKETSTIWNVANIIRGVYKHSDFRKVILPMTIIRRLECALAPYKTEFLNELEAFGQKDIDDFNRDTLASMTQGSGYLYNTSEFDLSAILKDETYVKENFINYIDGFSPIVRDILKGFDFAKQVEILDENDRLYSVISAFANLDLDPKTVDTVRMGYIFEDLIRRFSENEDAGDHFTGKDLVALSTDIILANGCDEILTTHKQTRILDQACGTGGMLMTTYNRIKELNPYAEIELWGQEINPESKAICTAEMLIREQDPTHIALGDTIKEDKSKGMVMNIIHMNPPFGQKWSGKDAGTGVEQAVKDQHNAGERFTIALPSDDMQLLFFQSALEKMDPNGCRCAIYSSGTPLFKGDIGSGDSKIREYMVKNDLIDAIIQLPVNLFYNTGISTYIWILDNNKPETRKGKIQLIDATTFCHKSVKALGQKTNELTQEDRENILRLYNEYQTSDFSKVLPNDEFLVRQFTTILPKRRTYKIDLDLLLQSGKLNTLYNPSKVDALNAQFDETGELTAKERTLLEKYNTNKPLYDGIVTIIKTNEHTFTSTNPKDMITYLQPILPSTLKPKEVENIVEGMSERDLSAPIQTDKKGNPIYDKETKDSEVLKGYDDLDEYMKREVLDYQPETHYESEPEKTGAEIAFNRYFYKYETPKPTEEIMKEIDAIDEEIAKLKAELKGIM